MNRLTLTALLLAFTSSTTAADYYKEPPQFHMHPDPKGARYQLSRLGPVGIGLELIQPAFTMRITGVEAGSSAEATGKLKKGQIIESINGQTLKDVDPRVILGNLITEAEATDGALKMMVKDNPKAAAQEVIVTIPALGVYSDTWPMNCKKSEKIIRNFADFLARVDKPAWGAALFLLSTGEQKDLDVVTRWFKNKLPANKKGYPWEIGYTGPAICEYYLRTGDESVLPAIKSMADHLKATIYNGSWAGRGGAPYRYMAGGHMNAAGVHCVTFLLLAKECGVDVDEHTLQSSLKHFYRYSGHGNVAYGDGLPEGGYVDNGRTGGLAFAMAAAASLTPEGEKSVYAKARDINATKSFYSTSWLFHGHTGGGIGELWRGPAMGLVKEKRPTQYRTFMNERRWMYELARTHDGAFGWVSGWNVSYTTTGHKGGRTWGNYIPMIYTIPRKSLRIHGAPKTQYSKSYQLPKRPWGTAADDIFFWLEPGEYKPGKRQDISAEQLRTDASMPLMQVINDSKVGDETLLMYAHHIDQGIRSASSRAINRLGRYHLVVPLLKSKDPRGRHAGVTCITGMFKGRALAAEQLTDEMFKLVAGMIDDPEESWWVVEGALSALGRARPELIATHVDRLAFWLEHEDWWLRKAAMTALTPVAADKRFYKQILPIVGKMIATNERAVALSPVRGIVQRLQTAEPEVQQFAVKVLGQSYADFPTKLAAPGGQDLSGGVDYLMQGIASNIANTPGGFDELYTVAKKRFPRQNLPHQDLYLGADSSKFGPQVKKAFLPILINQLIPEYIGMNRSRLMGELKSHMPNRTVDGLVSLYRKAGVNDYDWKHFGPQKTEIKWDYHTFDPQDGKLWERGWRYRKVTWPAGMETWFAPDFNPKAAGWKTGFAPFGSYDGKMKYPGSCVGNFCGCGEPLKTFWDKEVLMMRAEVKVPPMRKGHAYRLLVGGRSHVNNGDGSDVWINGSYMTTRRKGQPSITGVGKRQGGKPWGRTIDDKFRAEFEGDKIILAVSGFLRLNKAGNAKANRQSFWFEEMKLPTVGEKEILESVTFVPMLSMEWQEKQDPSNAEQQTSDNRFRYDGKFVPYAKLMGTWTQLGQVSTIDDYTPGKRIRTNRRAPLQQVTFKDQGMTDKMMWIWSGDTLMDLTRNQALKMTPTSIDGIEYLFIESGGFSTRNKPGWKPALYVLKSK